MIDTATLPEEFQGLGELPLLRALPIQPEEIVVAGAYEGRVMDLCLRLWPDARVVGFEPQAWAFAKARERLRTHQPQREWHVYPWGLGVPPPEAMHGMWLQSMGEWHTDAASFVNVGEGSREQGEGILVDVETALAEAHIDRVGLMVLNVEGMEFEILRHILDRGAARRFDAILVQWHVDIGAGGMNDIDEIVRELGREGLELVVDQRPTWTLLSRWSIDG